MRPGRHASPLLVAVALVALLGSAVVCEVVRDRAYGAPKPERGVLYVRSGDAVKRMALSYSALLADVYWIRALQYYGGTRLSRSGPKDYSLLYPLLDITTTLDPLFIIAYRFGAIFLAEDYPGGAGRPDLAVALLQKGLRSQPTRWQYYQDIGFVYYWWRHDYRAAGQWFEKGATIPGAPWWMQSMAAVTLAEGGDRRTSRVLWEAQLAGAENEWMRNEAGRRLQQLDALDAMDQLTAIVRRYVARTGTFPESWDPLIAAGELRGVPLDPTGVPYVLNAKKREIAVARASRLYPMPTPEQSRGARR